MGFVCNTEVIARHSQAIVCHTEGFAWLTKGDAWLTEDNAWLTGPDAWLTQAFAWLARLLFSEQSPLLWFFSIFLVHAGHLAVHSPLKHATRPSLAVQRRLNPVQRGSVHGQRPSFLLQRALSIVQWPKKV